MKLTGTCTWKQLCALSVELAAYVPTASTGDENEDRYHRVDPDKVMMIVARKRENRTDFVEEMDALRPWNQLKVMPSEDRVVHGHMEYPNPDLYYREFYGPGHKTREFIWYKPARDPSTQIIAYRTPGREDEDSWSLRYCSWKDLNPESPVGNDAHTLFLWMKTTRQFASLDLLTYYLHGEMIETNAINYALTMCHDVEVAADPRLLDGTLGPETHRIIREQTNPRKQFQNALPVWANKLWDQFRAETADVRRVMVDCLAQHHPHNDDNPLEGLRETLEGHGFVIHPREARALLLLLEEEYKKHLAVLDEWADQFQETA